MILILHALLLQRFWPKRVTEPNILQPKTHLEMGVCLAVTTEEEMCFIIMKSYHRALKLRPVTFSRQAACEDFFSPLNSLKYLKGSRNNSLDLGQKIYS